jgi:hypothetical protein
MAEPILIPFSPDHLLMFKNRETGTSDDPGKIPPLSGYNTTILNDNKIIGCAGVLTALPLGAGLPWMSLSEDVAKHRVWLTRTARSFLGGVLRSGNIKYLETIVGVDKKRSRDWVESFGFEPRGTYTRYVFDVDEVK